MSYLIVRVEVDVVIIYLRLSSVDINGYDQFTTMITSKPVKSPGHCYLPIEAFVMIFFSLRIRGSAFSKSIA